MKYIVDIKGEIEGDYEIIGKYEERPQGEWVFQYRFLDDNLYKCSNCGRLISIYYKGVLSDYKFCQECGASMKGGAE